MAARAWSVVGVVLGVAVAGVLIGFYVAGYLVGNAAAMEASSPRAVR